jgi:uncharacterized membrane protein
MHVDSISHSPTNLSTATAMVFFTRLITHLCAPVFVFLAGTSAYISLKNKGHISESRRWLVQRGVWLILLEFSFVNLGLFLDFGFHTLLFEVIAAIGFGFITLSLLLKLSPKVLGILGLVIIFCHDLLFMIPANQNAMANPSVINSILTSLYSMGAFPIFSRRVFIMGYPPVPWLGIMLVGFASGRWFELPAEERKRIFLKTGIASLLLFVLIRFINIYGDPTPWTRQKNGLYTFLSFLNITKYPPSLLFCLFTLGVMFLILAFAERTNRFVQFVSVYGKVPLFYFLIHLYLIHIILLATLFLQGFHWPALDFASGTFGRPKGVESGVALWAVYLIWAGVVVVLYKPCLWFGKYKSEHKQWWLKYI